MIYDGPNTTYPVLAGPFSGTNIPPQIISTGCVTIVFISDLNVAAEGFELVWEAEVTRCRLSKRVFSLPMSMQD